MPDEPMCGEEEPSNAQIDLSPDDEILVFGEDEMGAE